MSPERWRQIEEVFQAALDLPHGEREAYFDRACADDEGLRREVETLVAQYESAGGFIDEPAYRRSDMGTLSADESEEMIGRRVGAYRVVGEIARGGMGTVYLAERADNVFRRRVAVKLIKRGMDTDHILRRFRHERRILAALDHPYIARLLDGGSTDDGRPYFVMEYIEGDPLYMYCDKRRLDVGERLRLFCLVCEAVEYAHRRQVIHRDLKPSNILITAEGTPKLFDFGIGKLLDPELSSDSAPFTATSMRMMTVEYASPEQILGQPVTFVSDVYSLGVLLYELLTGRRPYRFANRLPHEMARVIADEMPEQPSRAVGLHDNIVPVGHVDGEADTVLHMSELRSDTPDGLRRTLSGDLDNIMMKALRKEPAERYRSAAALREDILRSLDGRPVFAPIYLSPASLATGAETRVAESRSIAVLPLKLLRLGSPGDDTTDSFLSVGLADALITRICNVRSLVVRPTSSVLRYGGLGVDPLQAGRELAVSFVLDGRIRIAGDRIRASLQLLDVKGGTSVWASQFDEKFTDALELEDSISTRVAEAVLPQLAETERRKVKKRGTDNADAFNAYMRGRYHWTQFTPESLPKAFEAFTLAIALDPGYALAHVGLTDFYNWANIYGILPPREAQARAEMSAGRAIELDDSLGEAYTAYAQLLINTFDWQESERLFRKALELSPNYPLAHELYAALLVGTGRPDEGVKEMRLGEQLDPLSLRTKALLAWTLHQAHRFEEALTVARGIIDLDKNFSQGYMQAGINLLVTGRTEEALAALRRFDELVPRSGLPKYNLCFALVAAGRRDEARGMLHELLGLAAETYVKPFFLAMAHASLDERDEALRHIETAVEEHEPWLIWLGTDPLLEPLRADPRFVELFRRTNNPLAERQAAGAG